MNYGLYLSASGVLTNLYRQDVFANNLANVETPAFKVDTPGIVQRDPESIENGLSFDVSKDLLDRLGGGVLAGRSHTSFEPAALKQTGRDLDVALQSANTFFNVSVEQANGQAPQTNLTRNGAFLISPEGYLVTAVGGHKVLGTNDQPIAIDPKKAQNVTIGSTGMVMVNGQPTDSIAVSKLDDPSGLRKAGQGMYQWTGNDPRKVVEAEQLRVGSLEASAVDPIKTLMNLVSATKAISGNAQMIQYHDQLMDRAVNTLGRVV